VVATKLIALIAACAPACLAAATATAKTTHYYLALGDSLARGAQPNSVGATLPTNQGYVDDLYATERPKIPGLKLQKLGCLGEATTTMMNGGICHYRAGSQLAQAVRFIHKHKVSMITLDIGANDIDGCVMPAMQIDLTCITNGVAAIQSDLPKILRALRSAAGPHTKIAAITYYDPFLADYLTGTTGQTVAADSVLLAKQVNGDLTSDFQARKVRVADVATAFETYTPFTTTTTLPPFGTVPLAVADICKLTWMCASKPQGPNIHANAAGYKKIATVLAAALH
jgi:lysophospholipase L1-like esterase